MHQGYGHQEEAHSSALVNNLARNLGNLVVFSFKAQGHHWNVKGMKFHMFHGFFREIYEEAQFAIDSLAEQILTLGFPAPYKLVDFARMSTIEDMGCADAHQMLKDLLVASEEICASLTEGVEIADEAREYAIADFLTERLAVHKKWKWQIKAHLEEM
jgi:starvation-inducible DNA-binding protein